MTDLLDLQNISGHSICYFCVRFFPWPQKCIPYFFHELFCNHGALMMWIQSTDWRSYLHSLRNSISNRILMHSHKMMRRYWGNPFAKFPLKRDQYTLPHNFFWWIKYCKSFCIRRYPFFVEIFLYQNTKIWYIEKLYRKIIRFIIRISIVIPLIRTFHLYIHIDNMLWIEDSYYLSTFLFTGAVQKASID